MEDQKRILIQLGLTPNQAKIYLTLAKTDKATASQIAEGSQIGREEIYRIMPKLQQLGLIESSIERPAHYVAVTEKTAITILVDRRKQENGEIEENTRRFLASIIQKKQQLVELESENKLTLVSGKEHLKQLSTDIINRVQISLDIICTYSRLCGWMEDQEKTLKKILDKKIPVRFIVETSPDEKSSVAQTFFEFSEKSNFQYKTIKQVPTCLGLYDDREITIIAATKKPTYEGAVYWSNNLSLITVGRAYFDSLWDSTDWKQLNSNRPVLKKKRAEKYSAKMDVL